MLPAAPLPLGGWWGGAGGRGSRCFGKVSELGVEKDDLGQTTAFRSRGTCSARRDSLQKSRLNSVSGSPPPARRGFRPSRRSPGPTRSLVLPGTLPLPLGRPESCAARRTDLSPWLAGPPPPSLGVRGPHRLHRRLHRGGCCVSSLAREHEAGQPPAPSPGPLETGGATGRLAGSSNPAVGSSVYTRRYTRREPLPFPRPQSLWAEAAVT